VDTLLFLRPTESLTVYLQQFGRGLRLHAEKECLTVLDFIGAQRREFRFAPRFRALSANPTSRVDQEIQHGFPHLPSGCIVQLERVAQQRVLNNVREAIRLVRPRMIGSIRDLSRYLGRAPSIAEVLDYLDTSLDELLKRGLWSELLAEAGLIPEVESPDHEQLSKGLRRLCHIDDADQIHRLLTYLERPLGQQAFDQIDERFIEMLHVTLWGDQSLGWSPQEADTRLRQNPAVVADLRDILAHRRTHAPASHVGRSPHLSGPLTIHSQYTRDEILVGLGHWSLERRPDLREGCCTYLNRGWMLFLSRCRRRKRTTRRPRCTRTISSRTSFFTGNRRATPRRSHPPGIAISDIESSATRRSCLFARRGLCLLDWPRHTCSWGRVNMYPTKEAAQ
jgi:hypothetical protein